MPLWLTGKPSHKMNTIDLIRNRELLNENTVELLRRKLLRYPYYQTLRLLLLENLYCIHSPEFNKELRKSSLLLADRSVLFQLVEGENYEIAPEAMEETASEASAGDRMLSLIESYLKDKPAEKLSHRLGEADVAGDYAAYLLQQEEEEESLPFGSNEPEEDDIVRSPRNRRETRRSPQTQQLPPDEEQNQPEVESTKSFFTETLAQIYIKQHKYERALEIIKALSVNNSKKNGYFADQIRFLEKLVLINKNNKSDNV